MLDTVHLHPPAVLEELRKATAAIGFTLSSDMLTGSLLRTLAATKPGGVLLELGTGTGQGTAWLLDGMDTQARLITVDRSEQNTAIARRFLEQDQRLEFVLVDGAAFIQRMGEQGRHFDLIFADTPPGKYSLLDETLSLLAPGGLYVIDDLLLSSEWDASHVSQVFDLITTLERRADLYITKLNWSSGLLIAAKRE